MPIRKALDKKNEWAYEVSTLESQFKQDCRLLARNSSRMSRRILLDISEQAANFGCGILVIDGSKRVWIAISSFDNQMQWKLIEPLKGKPYLKDITLCEIAVQTDRYPTKILDFKGRSDVKGAYDRIVDAECKILYSIAYYLDTVPDILNIQGDLFLYTDLEPCASCAGVIEAFSREFPQITLTVLFRRWIS